MGLIQEVTQEILKYDYEQTEILETVNIVFNIHSSLRHFNHSLQHPKMYSS